MKAVHANSFVVPDGYQTCMLLCPYYIHREVFSQVQKFHKRFMGDVLLDCKHLYYIIHLRTENNLITRMEKHSFTMMLLSGRRLFFPHTLAFRLANLLGACM